MKKCLILANCFVQEYVRHLSQSKEFVDEYEITTISTYTQIPDLGFEEKLKNADLIITQNVINIPEYTNEYIKKNKKNTSLHIVTEFWRFDGFWSYKSPNERKNNWFWFPTDEFGDCLSFREYMNYEIDAKKIIDKFENEIEKLKDIDSNSDIKIFDLFINNYKYERLFTDHWHPTPIILSHVTNEVLKMIGIKEVVPTLPPTGMNSNRYRLITNHVKDVLKIDRNSNDDELIFFGKKVTTETYYNFTKYLQSDNSYLIMDMNSIQNKFNNFLERM